MAKKIYNEQSEVQEQFKVATIEFDAWWATVEKRIPLQHCKEIIVADFKGRGLSLQEAASSYDEALKEYGLKLN
jgi:hypothetical protein